MPAARVLTSTGLREIIRLKFSASLPTREIARRTWSRAFNGSETLRCFTAMSLRLSWARCRVDRPRPPELEAALYADRRTKRGHRRRAEPDLALIGPSGVERAGTSKLC